jgi:hypothetical protein
LSRFSSFGFTSKVINKTTLKTKQKNTVWQKQTLLGKDEDRHTHTHKWLGLKPFASQIPDIISDE